MAPHHEGGTGEAGGLHVLPFLPLRSHPGLPSCPRAGTTRSRSLSCQPLRGAVHFSVQSTLNRVWSHRDPEAPSLSTGLTAT